MCLYLTDPVTGERTGSWPNYYAPITSSRRQVAYATIMRSRRDATRDYMIPLTRAIQLVALGLLQPAEGGMYTHTNPRRKTRFA